jgi:hypothetical protein
MARSKRGNAGAAAVVDAVHLALCSPHVCVTVCACHQNPAPALALGDCTRPCRVCVKTACAQRTPPAPAACQNSAATLTCTKTHEPCSRPGPAAKCTSCSTPHKAYRPTKAACDLGIPPELLHQHPPPDTHCTRRCWHLASTREKTHHLPHALPAIQGPAAASCGRAPHAPSCHGLNCKPNQRACVRGTGQLAWEKRRPASVAAAGCHAQLLRARDKMSGLPCAPAAEGGHVADGLGQSQLGGRVACSRSCADHHQHQVQQMTYNRYTWTRPVSSVTPHAQPHTRNPAPGPACCGAARTGVHPPAMQDPTKEGHCILGADGPVWLQLHLGMPHAGQCHTSPGHSKLPSRDAGQGGAEQGSEALQNVQGAGS